MLIIGNVCFAPHNLIQPTGSRRYVTTACLPLNQHDVASTVTNYAKRSLTQRCPERLFTPASRQRSDLAAIPPVTLRGQTDGRMRRLAQQAIHGYIYPLIVLLVYRRQSSTLCCVALQYDRINSLSLSCAN